MSNSGKATLAAVASSLIFGFSFLAAKLALDRAEPSVMLSVRFLTACFLMTLLLLTGRQKASFRGKPVGKLLLMGFIQPVIYFVCETNGIALTTSSFSGVMIGLIPVAGVVWGALFLKERCTVPQALFTALSVIGVALTTTGGFGSFSLPGFLYLLGAVLAAATFTVISRSLSGVFSAFERTYAMTIMGATVFTLTALVQNRADLSVWVQPVTQPGFWAAILYLAGLSSVCAFLLFNYAVNHLSAGHALLMSNVTTVVSVLAGIFIMGDTFTPLQLTGIALIVLSVFGVSRKNGKTAAPSDK
ncbi:MAG: EamA family transporter [Clostridia bacterium]|nr:EamA family transporter [Clostridia bacterium]